MNKTNLVITSIAVIVGICRFFVPTHSPSLAGSYQAMTHIFVGGLIGVWICFVTFRKWFNNLKYDIKDRVPVPSWLNSGISFWNKRIFYCPLVGWIVLSLSALELFAAFTRK